MRAVGELVAGKYRVERQLGEGGMGVVYVATHLDLHEKVAIKFVRAADLDENALARFEREARVAVKLRGEHVARILDAGRDEAGDPFIVMEYLEGIDLSQLVRKDGPLSVAAAADYLVQACHGLAEAHALGIVHRDVKPANLFLARDAAGLPIVKLLDFGISRATDCGAEGITVSPQRAQDFLGTPHFVSPEQLVAPQDVDARADIWSLGVTAWFLVTGRYPFPGTDLVVLLHHIMEAVDRSLTDVRADIPPAFAAIVGRCMKKARDARFADVYEVARDLEPFVSGRTASLIEHTRLLVERGRLRVSEGSSPPPGDERDPQATRVERGSSRPAAPPLAGAPPVVVPARARPAHPATEPLLPIAPVAAGSGRAVGSSDPPRGGAVSDGSMAGGMAVDHTLALDPARAPMPTLPPPQAKPSRAGAVLVFASIFAAAVAIGAGLGLRALGDSSHVPANPAMAPADPTIPITPPSPVPVTVPVTPSPAVLPVAPVSPITPVGPVSPISPVGTVTPVSPVGPGPVVPLAPVPTVAPTAPSAVSSTRRVPGSRPAPRPSGDALRGLPVTRD